MVETLLEREVPAQFGSVSSLRRATDEFLRRRAEDEFRANLLLVVSELCTNAVEALGGDGGEKFTLRVRDYDDRVEIGVTDPGRGFANALARPGASVTDPRGRGLQVVRSLVDELTVRRSDGRTTVRCVMFRRQQRY